MAKNDDQPYDQNQPKWQLNEKTQDDHTYPNGPNDLQEMHIVMRVKGPAECNDQYLRQHQPYPPFNQENTHFLFAFP